MKLPMPNEEHVAKMQDLYLTEFGVQLSRNDAFECLCHIAHFYYLTVYVPLYTIREEEPGGRGETTAVDSGSGSFDDRDWTEDRA